MFEKEEKGGQVTIFIIMAVLVVALGVLIFLYFPEIVSKVSPETKNPAGFIQNCIEEQIEDNTEIILKQGGDFVVNSNGGYLYKKESDNEARYVKYICYTADSHVPCINQEPFLREHFEDEILESIEEDMQGCFNNLVKSYENKGYDVDLEEGIPQVKILPNVISTNFNRTLTLAKGDENERYENFQINLDSHLYDMLGVAENIVSWEINVGDSMIEAYMYDNPYLRVEKHRKDDGTKIYVLTDKNTEEDLRFAVRSFAAPVGFTGLDQI
jgi:hypothetical protein